MMDEDRISSDHTYPDYDAEVAQRRARERQERFLADSVMREEMTPAEADALAIGLGVTFDGQNWPAAMGDPYWPLVFAILWVAWRDREGVNREWDRFRVWAGRIWRDPRQEAQAESLQGAEAHLWKALESGKVRAVGLPFMEADMVDIPAVQWRNLQWMPDQKLISVRNFGGVDPRYRCVDVESAGVLALWPTQDTQVPKTAEKIKHSEDAQLQKRGGGRPAVHDWAAAAGFASAFILENDYPPVENDLTLILTRWFSEQRGKAPDQRDIQRFVSTIYAERRAKPQQ